MAIRPEILDELLKDFDNPEEQLGQNGLIKELTKGLVERKLHAEMTDHLGYQKHATTGRLIRNTPIQLHYGLKGRILPVPLCAEYGRAPVKTQIHSTGSRFSLAFRGECLPYPIEAALILPG